MYVGCGLGPTSIFAALEGASNVVGVDVFHCDRRGLLLVKFGPLWKSLYRGHIWYLAINVSSTSEMKVVRILSRIRPLKEYFAHSV